MSPTIRFSPSDEGGGDGIEDVEEFFMLAQMDEEDDDIPSLDDIIPWSGPRRKPRQPPVEDAVRTAEGINIVFLENVLKSYFAMEGVIRDVHVEAFTEARMDALNISQRNDVFQVNVIAKVDGKRETYHMVIKTLTTSQPVRALSALHSFDKREYGLYTEIIPDINTFQRQQDEGADDYIMIPLPTCFFARYTAPSEESHSAGDYNIPSDESVVVLENVKYNGYTQTTIEEGLSREQVLMVSEGIARLNSLSLAMKERSGIPLRMSYSYLLCLTQACQCIVELYEKNLPRIAGILNSAGSDDLTERLLELRPHLQHVVESLIIPDEPMTILSHMNLWAHNILFNEDKCIIVDWQMISCTRPAFDLAFLLASSVKARVRRRHITEFTRHYYDYFTSHALRFGLDIEYDLDYSLDELMRDFRFSQLLALFFVIAKASDLLASDETKAEFVAYVRELDDQNLLCYDVPERGIGDFVHWVPRNPERPPVEGSESSSSPTQDVEPISGIYPVYEFPESPGSSNSGGGGDGDNDG